MPDIDTAVESDAYKVVSMYQDFISIASSCLRFVKESASIYRFILVIHGHALKARFDCSYSHTKVAALFCNRKQTFSSASPLWVLIIITILEICRDGLFALVAPATTSAL